MTLEFYDTLTRSKRTFKPLKKGVVTIYACGPTVYAPPHIGNYRTFLFEDLLRRWLEASGLKVNQVMNLTDVDDKTIKGAMKEGLTLSQYTSKYVDLFFADLKTLNIEPAEHYPRATGHIPEMVALVQALLEKGLAYKGADGSVYFSVSKSKNYGLLAGLDPKGLKAGARVSHDEYTKDSLADFVLWKAHDSHDGQVFWETPLGKGRPGWHLECSAMAMEYLGHTIDIHAGGVDLVFPHHQNEIAQSEGATGKKFANLWMHAEHLRVDGQKMSKSLGNVYNLHDLLARGISAPAIRMLLLSAHYRSPLNFTFEGAATTQASLDKLSELVANLESVSGSHRPDAKSSPGFAKECLAEFKDALDDDLNTPMAYAALFSLQKQASGMVGEGSLEPKAAAGVLWALHQMDAALGFISYSAGEKDAGGAVGEEKEFAKWVEGKVAQRQAARLKGDYAAADRVRNELSEKGVTIQDTTKGPLWSRAARQG